MFDKLINIAVNFYHEYSIVVIIIAVIILIIAYKKPKESFKFAIFIVIMLCVLYAVGLFGESIDLGKKNKGQVVEKAKAVDD